MTPQDQPPAPTKWSIGCFERNCVRIPDFGVIPLFTSDGKPDAAAARFIVETHNKALEQPPPDPPAQTLRALIEQKIEQWREKATGYAKRYGDADAEAWNTFVATRMGALRDCADELAALLTETDGPAPQNGTTNQTGTGETTRS
jgi:hypothetical protein